MAKIRMQEFLDVGLIGIVFILYGILSFFVNVNIFFIICDFLLAGYWIFRFVTRKMKKERDDDLSLSDKRRAGYRSFALGVLLVLLYNGYQIIASFGKKSFVITMDLRVLSIIFGLWVLSYYFFYRHFEKQGEDYDED
jgi:hypothetical protein